MGRRRVRMARWAHAPAKWECASSRHAPLRFRSSFRAWMAGQIVARKTGDVSVARVVACGDVFAEGRSQTEFLQKQVFSPRSEENALCLGFEPVVSVQLSCAARGSAIFHSVQCHWIPSAVGGAYMHRGVAL